MKNPEQISMARAGFPSSLLVGTFLATVSLVLVFTAPTLAQTNSSDSPLLPWTGVWALTDSGSATSDPAQRSTVEIGPTSDSKGLEITRHSPNQPDVSEVLIPDGARRSISTQNCTGWQSATWIAEAGLILQSSEVSCKDTGSFATSSVKMMVDPDQMAEILSVKAVGQHRVAVRRLTFEHNLASAADLPPAWIGTSARTALSAPWSLGTIIQLSKSIDTQLLEAAMIEKKLRPSLNSQSLRLLKAANTPKEIIDLTVALAYPDQFHIEKNGQVVLRPWLDSSTSGAAASSYAPGFLTYYPGAFYSCYSHSGYLGYSGFAYLAPGSCWSYYSPFWWDYPIYLPTITAGGNGSSSSFPVATPNGYAQIEPMNARHARPRDGGYYPRGGNAGAGWPNQSGASAASPSYSGGSGGPAGGGAPSASPGGYSSGGGGGGQAVPR